MGVRATWHLSWFSQLCDISSRKRKHSAIVLREDFVMTRPGCTAEERDEGSCAEFIWDIDP